MVLFTELGQAEAMELWIAEVFLREDFSLVLHALGIVYELANVPSLHFLTLVLL